jgi:hypothetical protein
LTRSLRSKKRTFRVSAKVPSKDSINYSRTNSERPADGWSSLVRIPVSHTGGREFESLPIHVFSSANYPRPPTDILPNTVNGSTQNRNRSEQKPYLFVQPQQYDKIAFIAYLQSVKEQEHCTAIDNASFVGTFGKSGKLPEDFIKSYEKSNSYNNALSALKHYCDFLGIDRPNLKPRPRAPSALIIAPKPADIIDLVQRVEAPDVKAYLALCATVGLRPERLRLVKWSQIDFENGLVTINEKHGMKIYRLNPLHKDVAKLLQSLQQESKNQERVFSFNSNKVVSVLKVVGTKWRPITCEIISTTKLANIATIT